MYHAPLDIWTNQGLSHAPLCFSVGKNQFQLVSKLDQRKKAQFLYVNLEVMMSTHRDPCT